jgi:hypothetical protein
MLIYLQGGPKQIPLYVDPDDTIAIVKSKLFEYLRNNNMTVRNATKEKLKLSYGSKRLMDEQTLRNIGIDEEDSITVNVTYFAA